MNAFQPETNPDDPEPSDKPSHRAEAHDLVPPALLDSLNESRRQVLALCQDQAASRAHLLAQSEALQAQVDHMHAQLGLAYEDIAGLERERAESHRQRDLAFYEREQALGSQEAAEQREKDAQQEIERLTEAHEAAHDAHQAEAQAHQQMRRQRDAEHARRQQEQAGRDKERQIEHAKLLAMAEKNTKLRERLLDMYSQLHARDLPSLILQVCVNLTGSECGLFVESDGDGTLAHEGFDELPEFIQEALYDWTRRVAREQEPVRENDSTKLPDHSRLVNLAALPVSLHSQLTGVILVANKRTESGEPEDYTEGDTELLLAIGRHASLALENRRLHSELGEAFLGTVGVLADAIEAKDAYTRGHCEGVSNLAVSVARRLGFDEEALRQIRYAALLHDVGKIGVPDGILLKPGRLLPEEFSIIQRHSQIGRDLVSRVPSLSHIAPIVMHHHERVDGTGYPEGLAGESISLASRIICVADAFDAMTSARPYRESVSIEQAIEELQRCAGTHFDPLVVSTVIEVLNEDSSP